MHSRFYDGDTDVLARRNAQTRKRRERRKASRARRRSAAVALAGTAKASSGSDPGDEHVETPTGYGHGV